MTVVGDGEVTVTTIVVGVSDPVTTIVDNCVFMTVWVCDTALVTVVVSSPVSPPSTATTEYEAGFLRSMARGHAPVRRSDEEREMKV